MGRKLYVGGLPYSVTEGQLQEIFAAHGTVESAKVIMDKFTGRPRGFGFVEMSSGGEAQRAIQALNGTELGGRTLTVNEAKPMESRDGGRRSRKQKRRRTGPLVVFSVLRTQKGNGSVCPFLHDLNHVVSVELAERIINLRRVKPWLMKFNASNISIRKFPTNRERV